MLSIPLPCVFIDGCDAIERFHSAAEKQRGVPGEAEVHGVAWRRPDIRHARPFHGIVFPCVTEQHIVGGAPFQPAEENDAIASAVISHAIKGALRRAGILFLGPLHAIPNPCVAQQRLRLVLCPGYFAAKKNRPLAARIVGERNAIPGRRAGVRHLRPAPAIPFPSVIQTDASVISRATVISGAAKKHHALPVFIVGHPVAPAGLRPDVLKLGPVLPIPFPGVCKAGAGIRRSAKEQHARARRIIDHRRTPSRSRADVLLLRPKKLVHGSE